MFVPDTFLKSPHYKKEIVGLFRKDVKAKTVVPSVDWLLDGPALARLPREVTLAASTSSTPSRLGLGQQD
jgi:hypothetical protein